MHRVTLLVDKKEVATDAQSITLKVDGLAVYKSEPTNFRKEMAKAGNLKSLTMQTFLKAAGSAFGHSDRFGILENIMESPKLYSQLRKTSKMTSPNLNYHLKKLIDGWIVYKAENGKYAVTILGELLLKHFQRFIRETEKLQRRLNSGEN